ncbi:MAG: Uma2 family endonuclease [Chloroflexota bacterium]
MAVTITRPELVLRSPDATWNRARWEALAADGNRYEVIDGVLYMTTAPSAFHQWIVQRLFLTLHQQIDGAGKGLTFLAPIGVFMPGCDPVQPDVVVVRASDSHVFQEGRIVGIPALLVEVQSPSHPTYDSHTKREAYARAGVPEYWIVRPATRDVLVCTQPDAALGDYGQSQLLGQESELVSPTLPVHFAVATLFAGAPDTTL